MLLWLNNGKVLTKNIIVAKKDGNTENLKKYAIHKGYAYSSSREIEAEPNIIKSEG